MSTETVSKDVPLAAQRPSQRSRAADRALDIGVRSLFPVVLALGAGAVLLLALGRNPITFYGDVWQGGVSGGGWDAWQDSAIRMAPLLLIGAGLTVVFRANIWNLGYNGQFLLAAAVVTGYGPSLTNHLPLWFAMLLLFLMAGLTGAAWTIVPAVLKARYGTNEIITTLMMSFIGVDLASLLIKGPFQDPAVTIPQTRVLDLDKMLPPIPGTRIHIGLLVSFGAIFVVYFLLTRTAWGLRLQIMGANPRAAKHFGVNLPRLIVTSFLASGFLIGLAAAVDFLGLWGYIRSSQNPGYGDTVIPFIFLARLNPLAVVPFIAFFSVLSVGGDLAATNANLSTDFLLVLVGLILLFMTVIEYLGRRRDLGRSYLPPGLREALRAPLFREVADMILASQVWTDVFWTSVVAGGLLAGLPLMFTALGETISERAGVLNIGLEGMMLLGAYLGFVGANDTGSVWVGFLSGIAAGMGGSLVMIVLCVWLGLDQIVVGIAITLAGEGITSVLQQAQFGSSYPRLGATPTISIPLLHRLPVLGTSLFEQPPLVYLAFALVGALAWVFRRTNVGLNLRAAGEKPEALDAAGVSVVATRSWAVLSTGALAGLGGAYLSIVAAGIFTPFITQGQGFMAIVIAMLGRGRPLWVLLGSFLFGIVLSLSDSLQLAGINISTDVVNMLPFAAIIIALIVFARRSYLPPALALPYVRGAR